MNPHLKAVGLTLLVLVALPVLYVLGTLLGDGIAWVIINTSPLVFGVLFLAGIAYGVYRIIYGLVK